MTDNKHRFIAVIEDAGNGGAYVTIPFDVEKTFGMKRVKIQATINGDPYRGTLVRMGTPQHILIIPKEIRQKIGKSIGDEVIVELEEDLAERIVDIPEDLVQALEAQPGALEVFRKLSYTHQKEYVRWVTEAKRADTRQHRIQQTVVMLVTGKHEY
jgi:bifunctional DNA-binding transcriptional regulator/antitoxin component of YhaV-PrlF toxin-antitoxin module